MERDWRGYIEVTGVDPRLLIQTAYNGSRSQGMGILHFQPGDLSKEDLDSIIAHNEKYRQDGTIDLDYVRGRAMKFRIHSSGKDGKRYLNLDWYDHSREAMKDLVRACGVPDVEERIAKAEKEKEEIRLELVAREDAAAQVLVNMLAKAGGSCSFKGVFVREEADPVFEAFSYGRQKAIRMGWVETKDHDTFTLTGTGRDVATVPQELPST